MNSVRTMAIVLVVFATAASAVAEDITVSTYYPSPRGVYDELRAVNNVAIGMTAAPAGQLEVRGNAATAWNTLLVLTNPNNDAAGIFFDAANRDWAIAATNPASGFGDQRLVFFDATAGFPAGARMVIDQTGNVGIGTATPATKLHVAGVNPSLTVGPFTSLGPSDGYIESSGTSAGYLFVRRGLAAWPAGPLAGDRFVWYNPDSTTHLWTDVNGDLIVITSSGNVGIGTAPTAPLDVNGTVRIRGGGPAANRVLTSGDASGNASWQPPFAVYQ